VEVLPKDGLEYHSILIAGIREMKGPYYFQGTLKVLI
jgi:hypothetical protein